MSDRTLEHFFQEMGAAKMLAALPDRTCTTIAVSASKTRTLLELVIRERRDLPDRLLMTGWKQPTTAGGKWSRAPLPSPTPQGATLGPPPALDLGVGAGVAR